MEFAPPSPGSPFKRIRYVTETMLQTKGVPRILRSTPSICSPRPAYAQPHLLHHRGRFHRPPTTPSQWRDACE